MFINFKKDAGNLSVNFVCVCYTDPVTCQLPPNVALMLARRLRRRPSIKATLGQRLVFAG